MKIAMSEMKIYWMGLRAEEWQKKRVVNLKT